MSRQLFEALRLEIRYNHETRVATCQATIIPLPTRNSTTIEEDTTMNTHRAFP